MRYRKRPVVIDAVQWNGNKDEVKEFYPDCCFDDGLVYIDTLEGTMKASHGDYIIKGVNGEFYPCKPDVFEKTYEAVE